MPVYEYECQKCGEKFEDFVWPGDEKNYPKCPKCGQEGPKRMTSSFTEKNTDKSCETRSYG